MNQESPYPRGWGSYKFDELQTLRKLKAFRLLNVMCWVGNLTTAYLLIQPLLQGISTTVNVSLFAEIALSAFFGFSSFKCEQKIKFIRYQLSHFSNLEHPK